MDLSIDSRFKIQNKIGEGSFGSIYEGIDIKTSKKVAIKLVRVNNRIGTNKSTESSANQRRKGNASFRVKEQ